MHSFELAQGLRAAFAWLEATEDAFDAEQTDETRRLLAEAQEQVDTLLDSAPDRVAALLHFADLHDTDAAYAKAQAEKWTARRRTLERRAQRRRALALTVLDAYCESTGEESVAIDGGRHAKVAVRRSKAVEVTDEDALPETFVRVKRSPNKTAIARALKAGVRVDGAELVERVTRSVKVR